MKKLDPFYWYLKMIHTVLIDKLEKEEKSFLEKNVNKHRIIQWLNLVAVVFIYLGLKNTDSSNLTVVINSLIAPVMVMGTAWFAISFGAVPARLLNVSMAVTFWMYLSFKLSLTAMFMAIAFGVSPFLWPVLVLIYLAVEFSCTLYDTTDALKAGLDEMILKHSRAALIYYKDHVGIDTDKNE